MNKQADDEIPRLGTDQAFSLLCYEPGEWKDIAVILYTRFHVCLSYLPVQEGPEPQADGLPPCGVCVSWCTSQACIWASPSSYLTQASQVVGEPRNPSSSCPGALAISGHQTPEVA